MPPNIRQPLFRGRCAVKALWFDVALLDEDEARRRVLANWKPGARLYRVLGGYLLEWQQPEWLRADRLDGLALCEVGHVLSSAPLTAAELATLDSGTYWLVRGAHARAAAPDALVDPSPWLALEHIALREPLRFPPGSVGVEGDLSGPALRLDEILGDAMPQPSAEREAFLRKLAEAQGGAHGRQGSGLAAAAMTAAGATLGLLGLLASWTGAQLKPRSANGDGAGQPSGPVKLSALAKALENLGAGLSSMTGLSKLMGWRHAAYLRKMLDMIDQGDLLDALRHAIPLSDPGVETSRQAFGALGPRDTLTIRGTSGVTVGIGLGADLQHYLRTKYRNMFERLDRAGKIDEAVYVLAELLNCGAEAVNYLEEKQRFKQAAQLADTLALAPDVAVRLWVLAGDPKRAVAIARLHNAFDGAVRLLESRQSEHAAPLRRQWSEYLAARGDLAEAIDAVWTVPEHHAFARACFEQAERAGGALGMRALARKLALMPETLQAAASAIEAVLGAEGEEGAMLRERFARELLTIEPCTDAVRRTGHLLLRQLIPESQTRQNQFSRKELDKLVARVASPVLRADLQGLTFHAASSPASLMQRATQLEVTLDERGLLPIRDARILPNGGYLLALGESGVVRISRDGKQTARYPVPADHLVLADSGQRALALARRDGKTRVSRIDLITGKVADWLTLNVVYWSQRYDGVIWNVVLGERLAAVDTTVAPLSVSWQVSDLPGDIAGFVDRGDALTMLLSDKDGFAQWTYALPGRQLRQRDHFPIVLEEYEGLLAAPDMGAPYVWGLAEVPGGVVVQLRRALATPGYSIEIDKKTATSDVQMTGDVVVVLTDTDDAAQCIVVNRRSGAVLARVGMKECSYPGMVVQGTHILMCDRSGRLVDIDMETGSAVARSFS